MTSFVVVLSKIKEDGTRNGERETRALEPEHMPGTPRARQRHAWAWTPAPVIPSASGRDEIGKTFQICMALWMSTPIVTARGSRRCGDAAMQRCGAAAMNRGRDGRLFRNHRSGC